MIPGILQFQLGCITRPNRSEYIKKHFVNKVESTEQLRTVKSLAVTHLHDRYSSQNGRNQSLGHLNSPQTRAEPATNRRQDTSHCKTWTLANWPDKTKLCLLIWPVKSCSAERILQQMCRRQDTPAGTPLQDDTTEASCKRGKRVGLMLTRFAKPAL